MVASSTTQHQEEQPVYLHDTIFHAGAAQDSEDKMADLLALTNTNTAACVHTSLLSWQIFTPPQTLSFPDIGIMVYGPLMCMHTSTMSAL